MEKDMKILMLLMTINILTIQVASAQEKGEVIRPNILFYRGQKDFDDCNKWRDRFRQMETSEVLLQTKCVKGKVDGGPSIELKTDMLIQGSDPHGTYDLAPLIYIPMFRGLYVGERDWEANAIHHCQGLANVTTSMSNSNIHFTANCEMLYHTFFERVSNGAYSDTWRMEERKTGKAVQLNVKIKILKPRNAAVNHSDRSEFPKADMNNRKKKQSDEWK